MEKLVTHFDTPEGAVVRWGPVLYVVWRQRDTAAPVPHADAAADEMVRRYGSERRLLYVHRTPPEYPVGPHSSKTMNVIMAHFERTETFFGAAALAIEATGFAGAAIRSVAAGVLLLRRSQVEHRAFRDARLGLRWLQRVAHPEAGFDAEAMIGKLKSRELCRTVGFEADFND